MKEREEVRSGKKVTVVEKEEHELSLEERLLARLAALEARVTALEKTIKVTK